MQHQIDAAGKVVTTFVSVLDAVKEPVDLTLVSIWTFGTGTAMIGVGTSIWVGGCVATGPFTLGVGCVGSLVLGAVPMIGGAVIDYAGYRWTKDVTVPAWENFPGGE